RRREARPRRLLAAWPPADRPRRAARAARNLQGAARRLAVSPYAGPAPDLRPAGVDLALAPPLGQISESRASRGDGDPAHRRGPRDRRPGATGAPALDRRTGRSSRTLMPIRKMHQAPGHARPGSDRNGAGARPAPGA